MSDLYDPSTIDQENNPDYLRARIRGFLSGLYMLPGAVAEVLPATQDQEGNVSPALPGVVTGAYGGIGYGIPTLVNKFAGTNLPTAPGAESAANTFSGTVDLAKRIVPVDKVVPAPESQGEQIMQDAMTAAGGMAVPIPGAAVAAIPTRLARGVVHSLAPTTSSVIPQMGIQAAATGAIEGALANQQPVVPGVDDILNPKDTNKDTVASAATEAPVTPAAAAKAEPLDFASQVNNVLQGGASGSQPAPTFSEQGESPWTVGNVLAGAAIFAGALAGARYFGGIGREVSTAARDARMVAPKYAQAAQDFNNAKIAAAGKVSIEPGELNAPLPQGSTFAAAKNQTLDAGALARDYIQLTSDNPSASARLANQFGLAHNEGAWQSKLREFLHTGVDEQTSIHVPQAERLFRDIESLPDAQRTVLQDGMLSANELDNRLLRQQQGHANTRHDFPSQSDQDLARNVVAMQNDPMLADIQNRFQSLARGMIDVGEARNFFTPQEANLLRTQHPNYVPEMDANGRILHAFGPRNLEPAAGIRNANTTPWSAWAQHIENLYKQMELNDARSAMMQHQLDLQRQFPNSAQWLTRVQDPYVSAGTHYPAYGGTGSPLRENILHRRTSTGIEFYRVDHPEMYNILSGKNATEQRVRFDSASTMRRLVQSGSTGLASTISGRAFPVTHMARVMVSAPVNRPRGYASGLLDRVMQKTTGGRLGYRLPDPTTPFGVAYSGARASFDDLAFHLGEMFDPKQPNFAVQTLKSLIGPQQMQQISNSLKNYYLGTTTHQMRALGLTSTGVPYRSRPPAFLKTGGESSETVRLVSGQMAPKLFLKGGKTGAIRPAWIRLNSAAEQIFSDIMDSSQQYLARVNLHAGMDPLTVVRETRELMGDPSTAGKGALVSGIRQVVPYANVSAQGVARLGRAFGETPVGTSLSFLGSMGSLAMLSILTAMNAGPAAVDYLQNVITTQGRAANVLFFGGENPELNTQFSLSQELRPVYSMMLDILSKAFNLMAVNHDPEHHDGLLSFFKDWFNQHIENSTWESSLHGLADTLNIVDVPSYINSIAQMGGSSVRVDIERIVNDIMGHNFGLNSFSTPLATDRPLPNAPVGDNLFEGQDAKKWSAILSSVLGVAGSVFDQGLGFTNYYKQTGSFWDTLGAMGKDWLQHAMDLNPSLNNILWENPVRSSMRTPIVESVQRQLDAMKVTSGAKTAEMYQGTTGGTRSLPVTPNTAGMARIPSDPVMRQMYFATNAEYNFIQSSVITDINAMKKQMQSESAIIGDNKEKREWMNQQTRAISDKYRYIQARIDDLNAKFSAMVGAPVNVKSIDWNKGADQFTPYR